jgi:hypothetical protein
LRLELQLNSGEPYLGAWIALTAITFSNLGMGVFFLVLLIKKGWPTRELWPVKAAVVYFESSILLAVPILGGRRWWIRLPRYRQWLVAITLLIVSAYVLGILITALS